MRSLPKGTEVVIEAMGVVAKGEVITADNWGTPEAPNWYIEMKDTEGRYRYWKQEFDGGRLVEIAGVKTVSLAKN